MSIINKIILMGRIASNPKLFKAKNKPAVSFNIAINDFYKIGENLVKNAQFIPVIAFGEKQSNYITNKFAKGNLIAIEGKIFF